MSRHEISFNTNLPDPIKTRADFTYKITPTLASITDTGLGSCPVVDDIEAVLRKIEHWHQGSISSFQILCRDGKGFGHKVHWDGKNASLSPLGETDEQKPKKGAPQLGRKLSLTDLCKNHSPLPPTTCQAAAAFGQPASTAHFP